MPAGLDLGKQVGPLPLGAWIAVVAGGLGLAFVINRNQANAPAATSPVDQSVGTGGGQVLSPDDPTVAPPTTPVEMDNEAWKRQGVNWLITQGQDPVAAELALRKYLDGQTLSVKERALVALVLAKFGSQPEPIAPTPDTPTTTDPTPGITVTKYPTTVKYGRPLIIEGRITKNGKPSAGVVEVELLRDDGIYRRHTTDGAGPTGKWNVILVAHPKGTRKYRLRLTYGKKSTYKDITIRVV